MMNYMEVLTININEWDSNETYKKGENDFYEISKWMEYSEAEDYKNLLAEKAWMDADETGTDEMRYFLISEVYGENEARQYWTEIHTDLYRVNDEGAA